MGIKEPDKLIEAARADKVRQFRRLCDEAIEEADKLLEGRGEEYNRGGVNELDYADALNDPVKTWFNMIFFKALRLKSKINAGIMPTPGEIADLINYARFEYSAVKMSNGTLPTSTQ